MTRIKSEKEITDSFSSQTPTLAEQWPELAYRELVSRIVASTAFARSERLCALLTYVCDMALKGRGVEVNEQKIGQAVFGRSTGYDSTIDGIVRTQASRLRQRLDLYFQQEGAQEPVRIVIPRGCYIPVFEPQPSLATSTPVVEEPLPQPETAVPLLPATYAQDRPASKLRVLPWALCALLALAVAGLVFHDRANLFSVDVGHPSAHPLWRHLFIPGYRTLVIPADSGLVMYHNMTGRSFGLEAYLRGDYRAQQSSLSSYGPATSARDWQLDLANRRYTSVVDLDAILCLSQIAPGPGAFQVRYPRDLRPNDLKSRDIILFGATEANPWVELFEPNMNFILQKDDKDNAFLIFNRSPRPGEPHQWDSVWNDPQHRVYGIVAFLPNLDGDGNALVVEGTSMSGTEGAWDFVTDDSRLLPFLKRIQNSDGTIPHFELLLSTQNMGSSAVHSNLIAWRTTN
ncbi:MAG TPA: hypothetical protein VK638_26480 [Edaphobacter sp.]|nr:hypothetical protein [Edaphobacter sp.]